MRLAFHLGGLLCATDPTIQEIAPDANERWVIFGSAAAVIAFLVAGMFENNFYDSEIIILMYFIMALPFTSFNPSQSTPSESTASLHSRGNLHRRDPAQGSNSNLRCGTTIRGRSPLAGSK